MIKVEVFISPSLSIEKISEPLSRIGAVSVSSMEMKLFGDDTKSQTSYRGVLRAGKHANKVKLEVVLPAESKGNLFKMLKELLGPEESLTAPIFITEMKKVSYLQQPALI